MKTAGFQHQDIFCLQRKTRFLTSTPRRCAHVLTFWICHCSSSANKPANVSHLVQSIYALVNKQPAKYSRRRWNCFPTINIDTGTAVAFLFDLSLFIWRKCQQFVNSGWNVMDWWLCFAVVPITRVFQSDFRSAKKTTQRFCMNPSIEERYTKIPHQNAFKLKYSNGYGQTSMVVSSAVLFPSNCPKQTRLI